MEERATNSGSPEASRTSHLGHDHQGLTSAPSSSTQKKAYFCHICSRQVSIDVVTTRSADHEPTCPRCHESFLEEMELQEGGVPDGDGIIVEDEEEEQEEQENVERVEMLPIPSSILEELRREFHQSQIVRDDAARDAEEGQLGSENTDAVREPEAAIAPVSASNLPSADENADALQHSLYRDRQPSRTSLETRGGISRQGRRRNSSGDLMHALGAGSAEEVFLRQLFLLLQASNGAGSPTIGDFQGSDPHFMTGGAHPSPSGPSASSQSNARRNHPLPGFLFAPFGPGMGGDLFQSAFQLHGDPRDYVWGSEEGLENVINQLMENDTNRYGTPPASKAAIDALPRVRLESKDMETHQDCAICKENFQVGSEVIKMPCGHCFDPECIYQWLGIHCECPTCRLSLPTDDVEFEKRRKANDS